MFEKHLWNSFLLYLVVEILQLVHENSNFSDVLCKEVFWKTFQNSQVSKEKIFLKLLRNSQKNILARVSFYIKLQAGNLKLSEAATGDVL